MFGRQSEEEKVAEAAAKVEADAKVKRIELERKTAATIAAKKASEAVKKCFCSTCNGEEVKYDWVIKEHEKRDKQQKEKQDYIDEKVKLTEKELLAEILWKLSENAENTEMKLKYEKERNADNKVKWKIEQRQQDEQRKTLKKIQETSDKERHDRKWGTTQWPANDD